MKTSAFSNSVVWLSSKTRFLFGKGVIETILYLDNVGKAGYYELYKQGFVVSRQTFANILKTLEEKEIVTRKVVESRPPRVEYSLTEKGKEIAGMLVRLNEIL